MTWKEIVKPKRCRVRAELLAMEYEAKGYSLTHGGWPDLVATKEGITILTFATRNGDLTAKQMRLINALGKRIEIRTHEIKRPRRAVKGAE